MKKKVLALFLSAALCVTVLPATGMAAEFGSGDAEITENAADSQEVFSAEETTESMGETEQPAEDSEDISEEMVDNSSDATMEDVEKAENAENSEDAFGGAEEGVSEEISSEDDPEVLLTELIPEEQETYGRRKRRSYVSVSSGAGSDTDSGPNDSDTDSGSGTDSDTNTGAKNKRKMDRRKMGKPQFCKCDT
mgnify:CR=1 FL=1